MRSGKSRYVNKVIFATWVFLSILFSACTPTAKTIEVTRIIKQTVVATRLVPVTTTPSPSGTPAPPTLTLAPTERPSPTQTLPYDYPRPNRPNTITPTPTETPEPTHVAIMAQQDPAIAIVNYYTLIEMHLYKDAYLLLSNSERKNRPIDGFILGAEQSYQEVKVLKVVQYNEWIKQNHIKMPPAADNVYYVRLYVIGYNMAEMSPIHGIVETYVWTVRENGDIKIEFHAKIPYD